MLSFSGLPNFVGKLSEAASQVTDLDSPEPALMHCLRAQIEANRGNVVTSVDIEEMITIELPSGDEMTSSGQPVKIQEEISSVTIVEATSTLTEEDLKLPEPVTTQGDISSPVIVEAESTSAEKQNQSSILSGPLQSPTSRDSKMTADLADTNVNQESTDSQGETVEMTPTPTPPVSPAVNDSPSISNSPVSSTAPNSCSDNTQFLARSPVYA
jgi:hypothetical protein